jgi:gluconolactonase
MDGLEVHDPRFLAMVLPNAPLLKLADGCAWTEGPVWFADHEILLFSDIPNNRVLRWCAGGTSVFREPSDYANGHARDRLGRLITCSHRARSVSRTEYDGRITVLASHYQGKRLNSPNDVVVKRDGSIWFTDPHYGINTDYEGGKQAAELPANVYRLDPDGSLHRVADDFQGPNGLCFSPDESQLYICETGRQFDPDAPAEIRVYDVVENRLSGGRFFHKVTPGAADGITVDTAGNLWSSARDGVHCIGPDGALLGKILVPGTVANLTFGGRNLSRLFICAGPALYAIYTNVRGVGG